MATRKYDTDIAEIVGEKSAAILEYISYWCAQSNEEHDGRKWIFQSLKNFKEHFPNMSESTIRRCIKKLADEGLIVIGNYNRIPFDKTKWYASVDEQIDVFKMNKSKWSKWTDGCVQNEQFRSVQNEHIRSVQNEQTNTTKEITIKRTKEIELKNDSTRFKPPTVDEVKAYCLERKNGIDPDRFVDYYTATGWMRGKTKMKDWKAAVRTWERKEKEDAKKADDFENEFDRLLREEGYI